MASLCKIFIPFLSLLLALLFSSVHSLTCSSQSFPNRTFAHCQDLPHLNAFLHWTHDPKNSSLSIAFIAPPPHSVGWVAWAINPTATGMAGSQALIATLSGDAPTVRTFDVVSYSSVRPAPLSFPVWDVAAEFADKRITIFATVEVPAKAKSVNHVWQVGAKVDPATDAPKIHEFAPANLKAKGVLVFDGEGGAGSPASAPEDAGVSENGGAAAAASAPGSSDKGGVDGTGNGIFGFVVGLVAFSWGVISFSF
ncbi:Auxin-induced in root cultures protein 12, partial [Cucurbita argyrosperma subsp. sororia]